MNWAALAIRIVKQLALDEADAYPLAFKTVLRDIYVDDLVTSVEHDNLAIRLYHELIMLFHSGGFDISKWNSNSSVLLENIPENLRLCSDLSLDLKVNDTKVLGLQWHSLEDFFTFKVVVPEIECTKRNILSEVARIFDPLRFLAPVTLFVKLTVEVQV